MLKKLIIFSLFLSSFYINGSENQQDKQRIVTALNGFKPKQPLVLVHKHSTDNMEHPSCVACQEQNKLKSKQQLSKQETFENENREIEAGCTLL